MDLLKRVLIIEAGVWAVCGLAIAVAPRFVLVTMFDLPPLPDQGYVRIAGVFAFSLSLLMVLVARRLETLWWFAWAFVIATAGSAIVAALNALFGLPDGASPAPVVGVRRRQHGVHGGPPGRPGEDRDRTPAALIGGDERAGCPALSGDAAISVTGQCMCP